MTWLRDTARGAEPSPGNTSPSEEIVGGSDTTGPDSSGYHAGTRPAYGQPGPMPRRARVRAS